jgi:hypothetical protein
MICYSIVVDIVVVQWEAVGDGGGCVGWIRQRSWREAKINVEEKREMSGESENGGGKTINNEISSAIESLSVKKISAENHLSSAKKSEAAKAYRRKSK